jgi:histidyl-tRNA synthetase
MQQYGYQEIRLPLLESTALFKRSIGEITDIVEKEMYTFKDLNGDSISLRPEGTASCIRACLEHSLLYNQQQKLWYLGPMFRHEKPQKGRYRQFNQLGVEALGIAGVTIELELISLGQKIWQALGLQNIIHLQINTLGTLSERQAYKIQLQQFLQQHFSQLDADSQRRLTTNPLRILDSKNANTQALLTNAPQLSDCLGPKSKAHFQALQEGLKGLKINYIFNP